MRAATTRPSPPEPPGRPHTTARLTQLCASARDLSQNGCGTHRGLIAIDRLLPWGVQVRMVHEWLHYRRCNVRLWTSNGEDSDGLRDTIASPSIASPSMRRAYTCVEVGHCAPHVQARATTELGTRQDCALTAQHTITHDQSSGYGVKQKGLLSIASRRTREQSTCHEEAGKALSAAASTTVCWMVGALARLRCQECLRGQGCL